MSWIFLTIKFILIQNKSSLKKKNDAILEVFTRNPVQNGCLSKLHCYRLPFQIELRLAPANATIVFLLTRRLNQVSVKLK